MVEGVTSNGGGRSYESCVQRLEEVVAQMERADLTLEESVRLFEEGMALAHECRRQLDAAEGKIEMLVKQSQAEMMAEEFEVRDE